MQTLLKITVDIRKHTIIQESFWHSLDLSYAFGTSQWLNGEFVSLVDFDFVEYLVGLRAK